MLSEVSRVRASGRSVTPAVSGRSAGYSRRRQSDPATSSSRHAACYRHTQTLQPRGGTRCQGGRGQTINDDIDVRAFWHLTNLPLVRSMSDMYANSFGCVCNFVCIFSCTSNYRHFDSFYVLVTCVRYHSSLF